MPDRVPEDQSDTGARAAGSEPVRDAHSEPDNEAVLSSFENVSGEKIADSGGRVHPSEDHHGFEHLSGDKTGEPEATQGQTDDEQEDGFENLSGTKLDDDGGARR